MLRVIRNHRRAAYNDHEFESVSHKVMAIDPAACPEDLLAAARELMGPGPGVGRS